MYLFQVPVGRFQSAKEILSTINSVTGNEIARVYISSISLFIKKKKRDMTEIESTVHIFKRLRTKRVTYDL